MFFGYLWAQSVIGMQCWLLEIGIFLNNDDYKLPKKMLFFLVKSFGHTSNYAKQKVGNFDIQLFHLNIYTFDSKTRGEWMILCKLLSIEFRIALKSSLWSWCVFILNRLYEVTW